MQASVWRSPQDTSADAAQCGCGAGDASDSRASRLLQAASLSFTAGLGLIGKLLRTKTGKGIKVKNREVFVADDAYLWRKEWLH